MDISPITVAIAFLAGLGSFLSPCVLPLVPGYISLISGVSIDQLKDSGSQNGSAGARRAVILNSLAFNAGLSMIFVSLGAAAGLLGSAITSNLWVRLIGGLVIILFGLQLIGVLKIATLYKDTRFLSSDSPRGMLGSFTLGMAFAAGWTPCIGPILGGILGLAATSGGWKSGLFLSIFYAAGLAIPFLLTGLGINKFLSFYSNFRRHLHKVEVVSGIILICIGLLIMTNKVTVLASSTIARWIPDGEKLVSGLVDTEKLNPSIANIKPSQNSQYKPAPDAIFQRLSGEQFRLSELRGRVVILNFWATWCGPCRAEVPELTALQRELGPKGLEVVGVSWDDTADLIKEFQKKIDQGYQVVLNGKEEQDKFGGIPSLPTTYIIDRQGNIREKIMGQVTHSRLQSSVAPLLNETGAIAEAK
jgi:cytochrome c-type biogenesis protein